MRRLRKAVLRGHIKEVQRHLTTPATTCTWAAWVAAKVPADINHIYEDDGGCSIAHYLAAGKDLASSSSSSRPASLWWPDSRASGTDGERAALLQWLLDNGYQLDFSLVNVRCQNVLHCCLLNGGSLEVLRALLFSLPSNYPPQLRFSFGVEDCDGLQPLELAVYQQQWQAVTLLLAAGAHDANPATRAARATLAGLLPSTAPTLATQLHAAPRVLQVLSKLPFGIGGLVGAVFGNADPRMQKELAAAAAAFGSASKSSSTGGQNAAGVASMELEAVAAHMRAAAQQVAYVVGVDEAAAMALLAANAYDPDRAIEAGFRRAAAAQSQTGAGTGVAGGTSCTSSASTLPKCLVCYEEQAPDAGPAVFSCGHYTCDECCRGILKAALSEGTPHRAACPAEGCLTLLPLDSAKKLLDTQAYSRYQQLLTQHYVDSNPNLKWCPRPGCGRSVHLGTKPGGADGMWEALQAGRPVDVACGCGHQFCWACLDSAHEPALCAQMAAWRQLTRDMQRLADSDTAQWVLRNTKPCPHCKARIQKRGGCLHMTCKVCNKQWCWACSQDWSKHSQVTGGFYQCTMDPSDTVATENDEQGAYNNSATTDSSGARPGDSTSVPANTGLISGIFGAVRSAALQHKQQHYLMQQSSHACDPQRLSVLLRHMQRLLGAMLPEQQEGVCQDEQHSSQHVQANTSSEAGKQDSSHTAGCCLPSARPKVEGTGPVQPDPPATAVQSTADYAAGNSAVHTPGAAASHIVAPSVSTCVEGGCPPAGPQPSSSGAASNAGPALATPVETPATCAAEAVPSSQFATAAASLPSSPQPAAHGSVSTPPRLQGGHAAKADQSAPRQGHVADVGSMSQLQRRLHQQGLQPLQERLVADWQRAVLAGSEVLCNSCVLCFFISNMSARRYLEHMQARVASATHQLLSAAEQLPHAQKVIDRATSAGRGLTASAVMAATFSALGWLWRRLGYSSSGNSSGSSSSSSSASARFDLEGQELVQQVAYCMAVSEQRDQLQKLMAEVWHWRGCLLRAARTGVLADVGGRAEDGAAVSGLTALDVVNVATSGRDAALGLVAKGAQQLWEFMVEPQH